MRRVVVAAVVAFAAACASHATPNPSPAPATKPGAPAPPPPPPTVASKTGEALRYGPSALRYLSHQVVHIDQELQGVQRSTDFGLRSFFQVIITGPADSIGYPTSVTVDSIVPDSGTTLPQGLNLSAAKGLTIRGTLNRRGELRNPTASDTAQLAGQLVASFRTFFPRLPAAGATLGAAWTDTVTSSESMGGVTVSTISNTKAAAWEQRDGVRCLRLDITSSSTIQGSGEQFGQAFTMSGTGQRTGVDYVAADGRFMGGEARDSTTSTITLTVQGATIPRTQVTKSTVTVLP